MKLWILWAIMINPQTGEEIGREQIRSDHDKTSPVACLMALSAQPAQNATDKGVRYFVCSAETFT